jgi:hypothetical protein
VQLELISGGAIFSRKQHQLTGIIMACNMNSTLRYTVLFLTLVLFPACARLPEYARPRMAPAEDLQQERPAAFTYRGLTTDDFRAASLSGHMAEHAERINAHAATQIRLTADSIFRITSRDLYGQTYFFGRIEQLGFEAVMLPDRSWWNPKIPAAMRAYVLQHEQIHFALTELASRQLNAESQKWAADVLVIQPTPQEVRVELARQINERINSAMEASLKRQTEFDEDTSLFINPKRQLWWSWTVENELKRTTLPSK